MALRCMFQIKTEYFYYTVKAEVHGSTEAAAQEHSDSDSGAEATRRDHHYEDIYIPREERQRRR